MDGPYRATKIWNEMLQLFKSGMPLKKHRRHMRVFESCFTGEEAVLFLQTALKDNPNIKPGVSKHQARLLLSKYLKAGVFSAVNASGGNHEFKENEVYRFTGHRMSVLATSEMGRKGFETAPRDPLNTLPVENRVPFYEIASCENTEKNCNTLKKEPSSSALGSKPYSAEESRSRSGRPPAKPNSHDYETVRKPVSCQMSNVTYPFLQIQNHTDGSISYKRVYRPVGVCPGALRNRYDVTETVGSQIYQKHEAQCCLRNLPSSCAPTEKHVVFYDKKLQRSPSYEFACHKVKNAQLGIPRYEQENVVTPNVVYCGMENKRNVMTSNVTSQYGSLVAPVKPPRLHNYTDGNQENLPPKPSKSEHSLHGMRGNYPSTSCRRNPALKTTADKSSQFPPSDLVLKSSFDGKCLTQRSHATREVSGHTSSGHTSGPTENWNTIGFVHSALFSAFMLRMESALSGSNGIVDLLPKNFRIDWLIRNVLEQSEKIERSDCFDRPEDLLNNFHEELGINEPLIQVELNSLIVETFLLMEHVDTATKQYKAGKTVSASTSIEKPITSNKLWNTNENHRILPEYFCFETAFASDTPVTRIIPQCAVDSVHLKRQVSKSFRCPREKTSSRGRLNETGVLKRNASESHMSSIPDFSATVRRSRSSQDLKELEDEYVTMGDLNPPVQPQEKGLSRRHRPWRLRKKHNYTESKEKNSGLQHCRNRSGGYVNPALSQSSEDLTQSQSSQEYGNLTALESLKDIMKATSEDTTESSGSDESSSFVTASSSTTDLPKICDVSLNKQNDLTQWTHPALALGITVYQLVLLLIPPSNRSSLGRLLRCLHNLPTAMDVKESFQVIQSMTPKILAYNDEALAFRIVKFLVLSYKQVLRVPHDFYEEVLDYSPQLQNLQVTREQFTEQGVTSSQKALSELLVQIVNDLRMGEKEKKKKLKMFQDRYPDIYRKYFPDKDEVVPLTDKSHSILQLPSFGKRKNMRV